MLLRFLLLLFVQMAILLPEGFAAPIYVFKEPDGSVRFSSKPPKGNVRAKVFTGSNAKYSVIRGRRSSRSVLFKTKYSSSIRKAALKNKLDESLIRAVIHAESAFRPHVVSKKGAQGLMQLMPGTARQWGVRNAFSPEENIAGGARHLAMLVKKYSGNERLALAAYNAGEQAVKRYNGVPPYRETQNYVQKVLALRTRYRGA